MSKKVQFAFVFALIGILLFCASAFFYSSDAWAALEGFERVMRIKKMFYDSIGYKLK
jgi:hypothetical protein